MACLIRKSATLAGRRCLRECVRKQAQLGIGYSKQQITGERMKSNIAGMGVLAAVLILGASLQGAVSSKTTTSQEAEATAMMSGYDAEQRAAAAARGKDAAWKPSCSEVALIQVGDGKKAGAVKNFCLNAEGN